MQKKQGGKTLFTTFGGPRGRGSTCLFLSPKNLFVDAVYLVTILELLSTYLTFKKLPDKCCSQFLLILYTVHVYQIVSITIKLRQQIRCIFGCLMCFLQKGRE